MQNAFEIGKIRCPTLSVERLERAHDGPEIGAEHFDPVRAAAESEQRAAGLDLHRRNTIAEQLAEPPFGAPISGWAQSRGGRNIARQQSEAFAPEALRRPVGHADRAARPARSEQLSGRELLLRGEDRTIDRQDHVERCVRKRNRLAIADFEACRQSLRRSTLARALNKRGYVVDADGFAVAPRGG